MQTAFRFVVMVCLVTQVASPLVAQDSEPSVSPWISVEAGSFDAIVNLLHEFLSAAGKPELSEVLSERLRESAFDSAAIDSSRPLGWYIAWPRGTQPGAQFVAIPALNHQSLVQAFTGDDVDYQWASDDLAVIDRPGVPYHIWFHDSVAWFGDHLDEIQAVSRLMQSKLKPRPDHPVIVMRVDLRQIPQAERRQWCENHIQSFSAMLQKQNEETETNYRWRRYWGDQILQVLESAVETFEEFEVSLRHAPDSSDVTFELVARCNPETELFRKLSRWSTQGTEWSVMANLPDTISAGGIRWDALSPKNQPSQSDASQRSDIGWAVYGLPLESRTVLIGLSGQAKNWFEDLLPQHRPDSVPNSHAQRITIGPEHLWWRRWLQVPSTAWISRQGDERLWLAFGAEDVASELLWSASQEFHTSAGHDKLTPLKFHVSATWLAGLVSGTRFQPQDGALQPLDSISVRMVPARRTGEIRVEIQAPLSSAKHLGKSLISELAAEMEQRIQSLK